MSLPTPDAGELKRVREVNVLRVINQLSGSISTIELTDEEKEQFESVYKLYQEKGGQILFSRKKVSSLTSFLYSPMLSRNLDFVLAQFKSVGSTRDSINTEILRSVSIPILPFSKQQS